jgi:murein DD-endopeptidase MepM/ murein hydrolase activator NlpD
MSTPTLGTAEKSSPLPGVVIAAVAAGLVAGGLYWWKSVPAAPAAAPVEAAAPPAVAAPPPPAAPPPANLKAFSAVINGPLELAVTGAVGREVGEPLTQVVNRSLVWWVAVPKDLLKGDQLQALYEERDGQEPLVHAVRFTSTKFAKTWEAWRYSSGGTPRFYLTGGEELEERLVDGPLDSWEQVSSRLRDGRGHQGVDFKTPVGTPVKATFDGTVTRKNWNFRANGNSVELAESGGKGRVALFLHLSEVLKNPGEKVKKGELIAKSGNTGHSFAPHLHYQLMIGGSVADPFEEHRTVRQAVPAAEKPKLDAEIARLRALLPPPG